MKSKVKKAFTKIPLLKHSLIFLFLLFLFPPSVRAIGKKNEKPDTTINGNSETMMSNEGMHLRWNEIKLLDKTKMNFSTKRKIAKEVRIINQNLSSKKRWFLYF
jgi:hypothetical protein